MARDHSECSSTVQQVGKNRTLQEGRNHQLASVLSLSSFHALNCELGRLSLSPEVFCHPIPLNLGSAELAGRRRVDFRDGVTATSVRWVEIAASKGPQNHRKGASQQHFLEGCTSKKTVLRAEGSSPSEDDNTSTEYEEVSLKLQVSQIPHPSPESK